MFQRKYTLTRSQQQGQRQWQPGSAERLNWPHRSIKPISPCETQVQPQLHHVQQLILKKPYAGFVLSFLSASDNRGRA